VDRQGSAWAHKGKGSRQPNKTDVVAFFDNKGLIYTNIVPRGSMVNANYIVKAMGTFMKHLRKKRPEMVSQEWFFHWYKAPIHTAAIVKTWPGG
jgi:hypothetical protein